MNTKMMITPEIKKILLGSYPLRYLDMQELDRLISYSHVVTFSKNEILQHQGKKTEGMHLIIEGKASAYVRTLERNIFNLATLKEGDFFGEVSLIDKSVAVVSVVAESEMQCLFISSAYFDMLSLFFPETHYKISKAIVEVISDRINSLRDEIVQLMSTSDAKTSFFGEFIRMFTTPEIASVEKISFENAKINLEDLEHSGFFQSFTQTEYETLLQMCLLIKAPQHCVLIKENEKNSPYFIILHGAVQACITLQNKIAKLSVLGPIHIFGSSFYFDENPSVITYITCERAVLLEITTDNLNAIQKDNLTLWYKIMDRICKSFVVLQISAAKLRIRLRNESYNIDK